jgi:folate-dependent phosphoribosylglycinamide formyltransferase PurN
VDTFRIVVLASGSGTNLQAILDTLHRREGIAVVGVASDKAGARALDKPGHRARQNATRQIVGAGNRLSA